MLKIWIRGSIMIIGKGRIMLKCRICGRKKAVKRQKYDPPSATICESICDGHEEDCAETHYFDAKGNEISGDMVSA